MRVRIGFDLIFQRFEFKVFVSIDSSPVESQNIKAAEACGGGYLPPSG